MMKNAEKESGERVLTDVGSTFWTMSFAPQGALPDVWCIFRECRSLVEWRDEQRDTFLKGLTAALTYFDQEVFTALTRPYFQYGKMTTIA
jgi:hypothetical protein